MHAMGGLALDAAALEACTKRAVRGTLRTGGNKETEQRDR